MTQGRGMEGRPSAALAGMVSTLQAGVGRQGAAAPGPDGGRFIVREVSMGKALQHCGVPEGQARELVAKARAEGRSEVRLQMPQGGPPGGPLGVACTLIVRRMRGNHAEAWALPLALPPATPTATGPGEAPA